ncbi:type III pantothenate kinase [Jejudonia soesokkakensis]|uniref:Type III pantothenate kinase n=1 Tax=Jejudonia soesokkakensis TaxID=1323432 RepID=A0ABW2MWV5_9FLAO
MNLIIDVGNTFIKLAVFHADSLVHKDVIKASRFSEALLKVNKTYPDITKCIVSSVGKFDKNLLLNLQKKVSVLHLTKATKVPFTNCYTTPETLGVDRIALVSAAAVQFSEKNVLIIDAGSCITYDFLTAENKYLGGAISPGLQMRFKAMHTFTASLPLLELKRIDFLLGNSTENSMQVGVFKAVVNEIQGFITQYKQEYDDLTVILTGGDAEILLDSLKNDIFANSNFLLEGLHYILEHNKN